MKTEDENGESIRTDCTKCKISFVTLPGKDSLTSGHGLSPVQHGVFNAIEMFEHPPIMKFLIGGSSEYSS